MDFIVLGRVETTIRSLTKRLLKDTSILSPLFGVTLYEEFRVTLAHEFYEP